MQLARLFCSIAAACILNACFSLDIYAESVELTKKAPYAPYVGKNIKLKRDAYLNISKLCVSGEYVPSLADGQVRDYCELSTHAQHVSYAVKEGRSFQLERVLRMVKGGLVEKDSIVLTLKESQSRILGKPLHILYTWYFKEHETCPLFALPKPAAHQ